VGTLQLSEIGSFYVEGEQSSLANTQSQSAHARVAGSANAAGEVEIGQTYVQVVRLAHPQARFPVLMLPGGSLSGVSYESTPDGRPGWQSDFLHGGYSVLIADVGQVGRSPWPRFPELAGTPSFRGKQFLWEVFRIGPRGSHAHDTAQRQAYRNSRFPAEYFDVLARQAFPRFRAAAEVEQRRYSALFAAACPCIVIAHSAAGPPAQRAALGRPELVKALVLVEPSGGVDLDGSQVAGLAAIPHLWVWGDNLVDADWARLEASSREDFDALARAGADVSWLDLPHEGVSGNSHLLMMDDNSHDIAARIMSWLSRDRQMTSATQRAR
jgi:pimeloyl-ACP methyl ester carboxylesterase